MARKGKRRRASKVSGGKKSSGRKKGFPGWVRPTVSMIGGGLVGLLISGLLPGAVAPYAPAAGVLASKFVGKGSWGKYAATSAVLAGVTFLSYRKTTQIVAGTLVGTLKAAKAAMIGPAQTETGDAPDEVSVQEQSRRILREAGVQ